MGARPQEPESGGHKGYEEIKGYGEMNKNLIEAKRRALMGPDRLRELHGSILGSGKPQEIYLDAESIFEDIYSKLTMGMDELSELLDAYREKRDNDGGEGRVWSAGKHLDADDLITKLEGK